MTPQEHQLKQISEHMEKLRLKSVENIPPSWIHAVLLKRITPRYFRQYRTELFALAHAIILEMHSASFQPSEDRENV